MSGQSPICACADCTNLPRVWRHNSAAAAAYITGLPAVSLPLFTVFSDTEGKNAIVGKEPHTSLSNTRICSSVCKATRRIRRTVSLALSLFDSKQTSCVKTWQQILLLRYNTPSSTLGPLARLLRQTPPLPRSAVRWKAPWKCGRYVRKKKILYSVE